MKTTFTLVPQKEGNCQYKPICNLYAFNSYTCTHNGGSYCGKYRKLSAKNNEDHTQTNGYMVELAQ